MTTTDAEAIARIIEAEIEHDIKGNIAWANGKRAANAILTYLASCREAQEPVAGELLPCPFCGGAAETDSQQAYRSISTGRTETAVAVYCTSCGAQHTICRGDVPDAELSDVTELWNRRAAPPPAPDGEVEIQRELDSARDEASDSLRTLDAIAEFVGCPHDEELTVDHVRQHYMKLENASQRQGIEDAGRIAHAEARAAGAPAGEVERLREALNEIDALDPEEHSSGCSDAALRGLVMRMGEIARAALNGGKNQ